jgi:hypothetical protein
MCEKARGEWAIKWKLKLRQYPPDDKVYEVSLTLCSTGIVVIGVTRKHGTAAHAKATRETSE